MPIKFLKSATRIEDLPKSDKPHIVAVGRSNVGKSSLLNDLAKEKNLARVSSEPGRTQTINIFDVDGLYFLIDLPGYGFAKTSKAKRDSFAGMIGEYLERTDRIKLVLLIVDARHGLTELDRDMLAYLGSIDRPVLLVVNKIDKCSKSELAALKKSLNAEFPHVAFVFHSSLTSKGRGEILEEIMRALRFA